MIDITFTKNGETDTVAISANVSYESLYSKRKLMHKSFSNFLGDSIVYSSPNFKKIVDLNLVLKYVSQTDYENFRSFIWNKLELDVYNVNITAISDGVNSYDIGTGSGNPIRNAKINSSGKDEDLFEPVPPLVWNIRLPLRFKEEDQS